MAVPTSKEARLFHRCAYQRLEEAQILLQEGCTTGAVYLAGCAVECILKSLVLSSVPPKQRSAVLQSFRGSHAHDYEWLMTHYYQNRGAKLPPEIRRSFALVNEWSTEMRYSPEVFEDGEAESFLRGAGTILQWADKRL